MQTNALKDQLMTYAQRTPPSFSWSLFIWQMLIIATIILWIYALKHISKRPLESKKKLKWVLLIIFIPVIGAVLYFKLCED